MKKGIFIFLVLFAVFIRPAFSDPNLNISNTTAEGGNTTLLSFDSTQETSQWQGYFGTVTGGIFLKDSSDNIFYDWNVVDAVGEILATRSLVPDWSIINCTNQTEIYDEEKRLNIENISSSGINDTYLNTTHPNFDVAGRSMAGCRSTLTYNFTESQAVFWNVILNANATTTVYVSLIDNNKIGFNGSVVDFQLLVPVDKLTGQSLYNIYVQLG